MRELFTSTTVPAPGEAQNEIFVPFQAQIRVVPDLGTGKRRTMIHNLEKKAIRVEQDLEDINNLTISSVAFTPQFGDHTARLSIAGFFTRLSTSGRQNLPPVDNTKFVHSGTDQGEKTATTVGSVGGSLSFAQDPAMQVDNEVTALRSLLASSTTEFNLTDVIAIEYNGVKYGVKKQGHRSFPL